MKQLFWTVFLCLILSINPATAEVEVKLGGGFLTDPTRLGGNLSLEIPLNDGFPTYLAPFFEYYGSDDLKVFPKMSPIGISLIYKALMSSYGGTVYFGVLGGLLMSQKIPEASGVPSVPSSKDAMIGAGGGVQFGFNDRIGTYGQIRWFRLMQNDGDNNISIQGGLSFKIGEI